MNMDTQVSELLDFTLSRRNLVRGSIATGAVFLATSVGLSKAFAQESTDEDILQFALTLEHLEARLYVEALATGLLKGKEKNYLQSFGAHEAAHVKALSDTLTTLGAKPADAQSSYNFPAFNTREDILNFAKVVEDTTVGAYQGAAAALRNKTILAAAGSIVQVEARHVAMINLLLNLDPVPTAVTPSLSVDEVNKVVIPLFST
ncbi:MAG: ferritin-like domain-containing protein [Caldilineaceae bacterium]